MLRHFPLDNLNDLYFRVLLRCVVPSGERQRITITVEDKCGPGRLPCRDGTCRYASEFCDGRRDCADGSDEYDEYCESRLSSLLPIYGFTCS